MDKITANKIITKPIISEKSMQLKDAENQFAFEVNKGANKIEVKKAVELLFKVSVLKVRMINVLGKRVTFGKNRIKGQRSNTKKAIVTLKVGDKIDIFEVS